jgi:hypothetical protein
VDNFIWYCTLLSVIFDLSKQKAMTTLNLQSMPISQKTANEIASFVYNNRNEMSKDLMAFYQDVKGFIEMQLKKPVSRRMNMSQILDRSYNIEQYILKSGAASYQMEVL